MIHANMLLKNEKLKNKIFKKVQDMIQYAMQAETEFFFF